VSVRDRKVGFVGLGNMGGAMVEAILADGYRVWVYDIDAAAASALEPLGAQEAPGPGALAAQADVILTSLPDARAVRAVYLGEEGLVSGARPGTVLVELSTIDPATIEELERVVSERGAVLLDVPVSGSPDEARRGELVLTAGGEREALAAVEPILKCFGRTIQYVGPAGAAKIVKIVNNMMTMGNVLVAAEAFCVGVKAGIAPDLLFEVLSGSGGRSHHFTKRFPNALAGDFKPGFSVALGEKDLGLALELSRSLDMPSPTTGLVRQMYLIAMSEGLSSEDIVAIIKLFEKWSGVQARGAARREASGGDHEVEAVGEGPNLTTELLRRIEAKLNEDPVVVSNARWYRATLRLVCDEHSWDYRVADGRVQLVEDGGSSQDPQVRIWGSSEDWRPVLRGLRGGLHRAFRHRLLTFDGDAVATLMLWKTIWRLGEALAEAGQEG
jgi:3-hydroxyisobutyrate dehydrogenase-like beta-hydroxyacid dehydrogenase